MKRNILLLLSICLAACTKEGTLQEEKHILEISASSYWADETAVSALTWNDALVMDSMSKVKNGFNKRIVEKVGGQQHLKLKDLRDGQIWMDTLLDISDNFVSITILQFEKTGKPQFLLNKRGEAAAPDKRKIGFTFSDPELPEKLTLELYRVKMINPITPGEGMTEPIVIFENIQRGKFTGFTTINYFTGFETGVRFVYKLKNAATNTYLLNGDVIDPARYTKGGRFNLNANSLRDFGSSIYDIKRNVAGGVVTSYVSNYLAAF
ncbi:hypothetical protein GFS24_13490 [Chitinophaga sp. SYP-B3965]|uniref:hypothetical protein n=1 Tax=Chitinophaga sp. SYP-B3965 TaxID=2663120 RepID=UPI001299F60C|nr:hypothetical protein [Chitinophaga sp. SYP-B3965]MRG46136.1 hypothetical protein [Chitinophaga sp. SYP-B3965]